MITCCYGVHATWTKRGLSSLVTNAFHLAAIQFRGKWGRTSHELGSWPTLDGSHGTIPARDSKSGGLQYALFSHYFCGSFFLLVSDDMGGSQVPNLWCRKEGIKAWSVVMCWHPWISLWLRKDFADPLLTTWCLVTRGIELEHNRNQGKHGKSVLFAKPIPIKHWPRMQLVISWQKKTPKVSGCMIWDWLSDQEN